MDSSPPGSSVHADSPGKNTGVGYHALLQGVLPKSIIEPRSPTFQAGSLPSEPPGQPKHGSAHIGFPDGTNVKKLPASEEDARDEGLFSGLGRSPGEGNGNSLQYSCLGNPIDRGAWRATVRGVTRVGHD